MSDLNGKAYDAVSKAAWALVRECIHSLEAQIEAGEITDEESLSDAIHTVVDDSLIYTIDQYVCVWGLKDEEDAIEEGLCSPSDFGEALCAQAYCNLRSAVQGHDFSAALEVASDAREEGGES